MSAYIFGDGTAPPVPAGAAPPDSTTPSTPAAGSAQPIPAPSGATAVSMSAQSVKSLADRRVRRQKIFIAVGSVVLLAVLGFELPKVMGHKSGVSAAPAITAATPGVGTPAVVVPAGKLPDTDRVSVMRDTNQLISFGLFKSKDPFVQQISASTRDHVGSASASARPRDQADAHPCAAPRFRPASSRPAVPPRRPPRLPRRAQPLRRQRRRRRRRSCRRSPPTH